KGHRRGVWCVAFSPIDQVVASASGDATIRLWNLKDFRAIRSFQGHSSAVLRVAFLANGMQLMSSSVDGLLKLWHIRTAECAGTFEEHSSKVWCVDIVGDRMVSGGADSKICPLSGMMGTQRGVGTWNKLYQSC
ncbi:TBL3, partial [Symbiodinium pilosum]